MINKYTYTNMVTRKTESKVQTGYEYEKKKNPG